MKASDYMEALKKAFNDIAENNKALIDIVHTQSLAISGFKEILDRAESENLYVSDEEFIEAFCFYDNNNSDICREVWGYPSLNKILKYNYLSEFVSKYKKYKQKENKIKVGDEIRYSKAGERVKGVVLQIFNELFDDIGYKVLCENGCGQIVYHTENIEKTGRHFDEIGTLLSKLSEGED